MILNPTHIHGTEGESASAWQAGLDLLRRSVARTVTDAGTTLIRCGTFFFLALSISLIGVDVAFPGGKGSSQLISPSHSISSKSSAHQSLFLRVPTCPLCNFYVRKAPLYDRSAWLDSSGARWTLSWVDAGKGAPAVSLPSRESSLLTLVQPYAK